MSVPLPPSEPTRDDLAYLAGIIDGEGSVFPTRRRDRPGTYELKVSITNTNPILVVWLSDTFGFGVYPQEGRGNCKSSWVCALYSDKAVSLLRSVLPFMKLKVEQAKIVIAMREIQLRHGAAHPALATLADRVTQLNRRGVA